MGDPVLQEVFLIIFLVIKSNYSFNVKPFEDLYVLIRVMAVSLISVTFLNRTHERHKSSWDNPVDITVLDSFEELVLLHVECLEVVPAELNGVL